MTAAAVLDGLRGYGAAARSKLLGVAFLAVVVGMLGLSVAQYEQVFTPVVMVSLDTDRTGNQLDVGSDVKLRGLEVGEVRSITATPQGAVLKLALQPNEVGLVPADVAARILPKTLFGEKFVDLVPQGGTGATVALKAGDVIPQDRSAVALEVGHVFDDLVPLLRAVQPAKLSTTLNAVATALQGRGDELGQSLTDLDTLLQGVNPVLPQVDKDISGIADLATTYSAALPAITKTLDNLSFTSRTLVAKKQDLHALLTQGNAALGALTQTLDSNESQLIHLTSASAPVLDTLRDNGQQIPFLLHAHADYASRVDQAFGGPQGPYLHINLSVVPDRGAYTVAGGDCPKYPGMEGPNCPGAAASSSSGTTNAQQSSLTLGGDPGTVAEARQVDNLIGASTGQQPDSLGAMGDILFAPLLRGTQVEVS